MAAQALLWKHVLEKAIQPISHQPQYLLTARQNKNWGLTSASTSGSILEDYSNLQIPSFRNLSLGTFTIKDSVEQRLSSSLKFKLSRIQGTEQRVFNQQAENVVENC